MTTITWFTDSPDAGDPKCICSWCGELIEEKHAPAVRMFDSAANTEARFHRGCYNRAIGATLKSFDDDEEDDSDYPAAGRGDDGDDDE